MYVCYVQWTKKKDITVNQTIPLDREIFSSTFPCFIEKAEYSSIEVRNLRF